MKRILEENLAGAFLVRLARDPWQGQDLPLTLDICPSPTCDCRQVHVACPDPENGNATLRFTVSLDDNALAEVSDHGRVPFFEAVVDALQEPDWARLQAAYYQAKEVGMETADLGHLAVTFPADALGGGCFVGYHELIPDMYWPVKGARPFLYGSVWGAERTAFRRLISLRFAGWLPA